MGTTVKKISSVLLIVFCILAFSSCDNNGLEDLPSWLSGKTWCGNVTITTMGVSQTQFMSIDCEDGNMNSEDIPEGLTAISSGNSQIYQIALKGMYDDGVNVMYIEDGIITFSKITNNSCKLNATLKTIAYGMNITATMSGTLYAY